MTPHCCPVCYGKGIVPPGFYLSVGLEWASTNTAPETCRSCSGTGVVWNSEPPATLKVEDIPTKIKTKFFIGGVEVPMPEYEVICEGQSCIYREKR